MNVMHNIQFPMTWNDKDLDNFDWVETYMIDEVPTTDRWDNFATDNKLKLEKLYIEKNLPKMCSKHYMCFSPQLSTGLQEILNVFKDSTVHYNFLKLSPGYNVWMHYDSYSTFVKHNNISQEKIDLVNRTAIFMTKSAPGQVLQIGNEIFSNWTKGSSYTWQGQEWHGAANFGFDELIVMQVTWLKND